MVLNGFQACLYIGFPAVGLVVPLLLFELRICGKCRHSFKLARFVPPRLAHFVSVFCVFEYSCVEFGIAYLKHLEISVIVIYVRMADLCSIVGYLSLFCVVVFRFRYVINIFAR